MLFTSDIKNIVRHGRGVRKMRAELIAREECNGWTNTETWLANLWLSNEQETQERAYDICDPAWRRTKHENGRMLRKYVEDLAGYIIGEASMRADMFGCALDRVVWSEIAEAFAER